MGLRGVRSDVPFVLDFDGAPGAEAWLPLVREERAELEAVLGTRVVFAAPPTPQTQRWVVRVDASARAARLEWDASAALLTSVLRGPEDFGTGLNLLHSLAHATDDVVEDVPCPSYPAAFDRIHDEVANIYPSFALRGLDWDEITDRHRGVRDLEGAAFLDAAEAWVAELGDAHTRLFVAGPGYHPPYVATLEDAGARLLDVPAGSCAADAGVGVGWVVAVHDPAGWLRRTGASPQHRTMVAARRFLQVHGETRTFTARSPGGRTVEWVERRRPLPVLERTADGLRLRTFTDAVVDEVDEVLDDLADRDEITVDLRGNSGGVLTAATALRSRFLHEPTRVGSVRFTDGRGTLTDAVDLHAQPHARPWLGRVRILVDAMTYSASEDFVLGLQGLPHVTVVGTPSGGGSGRPHTRAVVGDAHLAVSTALTYDRTGRCIELNGLPVDAPPAPTARAVGRRAPWGVP